VSHVRIVGAKDAVIAHVANLHPGEAAAHNADSAMTIAERGPIAASACSCGDECTCAAPRVRDANPSARRWAWWLTTATIAWNVIEAVVAIGGGVLAGSIALVGFGLDSVVEVSSALVIVWRLSRQCADQAANVTR